MMASFHLGWPKTIPLAGDRGIVAARLVGRYADEPAQAAPGTSALPRRRAAFRRQLWLPPAATSLPRPACATLRPTTATTFVHFRVNLPERGAYPHRHCGT
jgi:hypothetical protein